MPKPKTVFVCQECGNESPKWEGRCPACNQWNTLAETSLSPASHNTRRWLGTPAVEQELSQMALEEGYRFVLPHAEVNRVLGSGVVPGSLILVAGDPGIGKSTLLLQIADSMAGLKPPVMYVSGEESASQVKMRAGRLGVSGQGIFFLAATEVQEILDLLDSRSPSMAVIDSIQTVYDDSISSSAGTVVQIRECTRRIMQWAKARNTPVFLTGHVTKGGDVAGPRVLEHMVDVVLYMEGEAITSLRLLRSVKNRFGASNEVGVFEMQGQGLVEVTDPSRAFLSQRKEGTAGSAIIPTLEGSRPLVVEVQALTSPSILSAPRRMANGLEFNRLLLIGAVLSQRGGLPLGNQDILVNVAGGLKVNEPAADLGTAMAIASSFRNEPLPPFTAFLGELGLSGEIRAVPQLERRLSELARLGFNRCLVSERNLGDITPPKDFEVIPVSTVSQGLSKSLPRRKDKDRERSSRLPSEESELDLNELLAARRIQRETSF